MTHYPKADDYPNAKRGADHWNWTGDDVTDVGGRKRARRLFPEIGPCAHCGNPKSERHHIDENPANNPPDNILPPLSPVSHDCSWSNSAGAWVAERCRYLSKAAARANPLQARASLERGKFISKAERRKGVSNVRHY